MRKFLAASLSAISIAFLSLPKPVHADMATSTWKMTGSAAGLPNIDISTLKGTMMVPIKNGAVAGDSFAVENLWQNDDETLIVYVVRRPG